MKVLEIQQRSALLQDAYCHPTIYPSPTWVRYSVSHRPFKQFISSQRTTRYEDRLEKRMANAT